MTRAANISVSVDLNTHIMQLRQLIEQAKQSGGREVPWYGVYHVFSFKAMQQKSSKAWWTIYPQFELCRGYLPKAGSATDQTEASKSVLF